MEPCSEKVWSLTEDLLSLDLQQVHLTVYITAVHVGKHLGRGTRGGADQKTIGSEETRLKLDQNYEDRFFSPWSEPFQASGLGGVPGWQRYQSPWHLSCSHTDNTHILSPVITVVHQPVVPGPQRDHIFNSIIICLSTNPKYFKSEEPEKLKLHLRRYFFND